MIGVHIGFYQHVRARLAGGIGAVGRIGRGLIKILALVLQGTIDLVRGDMEEFLSLLKGSVLLLPGRLRAVEHHRRAKHVGLHEDLGIFNASVHMALRREMHHPVDVVFREDLLNRFLIADVGADEGVVIPSLHVLQVFQISRIGQGVHVDDADFVPVFLKHIVNIIGADEAGAARYQIGSHVLLRFRLCIFRAGRPAGTCPSGFPARIL